MISYAILDTAGLVIGTGTAQTFLNAQESSASIGTAFQIPASESREIEAERFCVIEGEFHTVPDRPDPWSQWDGTAWIDPRSPEQVDEQAADELARARAAMVLSVPQLLAGLVAEGWITRTEGRIWAAGNGLPASATALIETLPEIEQFAVEARLYRMSQAERLDPLVIALATAEGKTDAEIDAFFLTYSTI